MPLYHGLQGSVMEPYLERDTEGRASSPGPAPSLTGTRKKCLQLARGLVRAKLCLFAMEILVVTETNAIQAASRKLLFWGGFFGTVSDIHSSQSW